MKSILVTLITILLFITTTNAGIFNSKGDVKAIDIDRLKKHLKTSSKGTFVAFYAPWCGHCKSLQPEFEKAATNVKNLVVFAAVDCDADQNKASCGRDYGVKGFPTIKYFPGTPVAMDYDQERKAKSMVDYSLRFMPTFAKKIKSKKDLQEKISKSSNDRPLVVLFTTATATTPTFKSLSSVFHKKMEVYTATPKAIGEETAKELFSMESIPGLIVFKGNTDYEKFKGKMNYNTLYEFIKKELQLAEKSKSENQKAKDEL
ncbi:PDI family protein [Melampsora larici-populina 98AG31]|uniref:PDI family protein n=1 Tax=Melampsora larici-populina (strain 98AG31 / pathotype 3-4-7) TaxID=747676 RepID=F4R583_MELLP|nr:PDI family protein [Melampsora larici-populina 98AG31]EGG12307.1 PDI family protein [Melampsora larici-populina 98AG31]